MSMRRSWNLEMSLLWIVVLKIQQNRGSNHYKVTFKISGISFICKGIPPLNEISTLGASPLKRAFFVSNNILFTYTDIDLITQFRTYLERRTLNLDVCKFLGSCFYEH